VWSSTGCAVCSASVSCRFEISQFGYLRWQLTLGHRGAHLVAVCCSWLYVGPGVALAGVADPKWPVDERHATGKQQH
jgi:hypothetical protein